MRRGLLFQLDTLDPAVEKGTEGNDTEGVRELGLGHSDTSFSL